MNAKHAVAGACAAGAAFAVQAAASAGSAVSGAAPLCTAVCGTCGGGCLAVLGSAVWLSAAAAYGKYRKKKEQKEESCHE